MRRRSLSTLASDVAARAPATIPVASLVIMLMSQASAHSLPSSTPAPRIDVDADSSRRKLAVDRASNGRLEVSYPLSINLSAAFTDYSCLLLSLSLSLSLANRDCAAALGPLSTQHLTFVCIAYHPFRLKCLLLIPFWTIGLIVALVKILYLAPTNAKRKAVLLAEPLNSLQVGSDTYSA